MGDQERNWVEDIIEDGQTPVEGDPYDPAQAEIVAVETGPRRRRKVGEVMKGGKRYAVYEYAVTEVAVVFNEATGKFEYVPAGKLDALSNQRVHRDEQQPLPLGAGNDIDLASLANDRAEAATRRRRVRTTKIGEKR